MKDARLEALKVGLVCAAVLFVLYVMMSLLINNSLYDYYNKPQIKCAAEVILSIAAVMIYEAALSAGNLLPYFRDIYTYQIAPASFLCMPIITGCGIISVFFGYLLYAARRTGAGKSPGK